MRRQKEGLLKKLCDVINRQILIENHNYYLSRELSEADVSECIYEKINYWSKIESSEIQL